MLPNGWRAQVKARAGGWCTLYRALDRADLLALKANRRPWLVVLWAAAPRRSAKPLMGWSGSVPPQKGSAAPWAQ